MQPSSNSALCKLNEFLLKPFIVHNITFANIFMVSTAAASEKSLVDMDMLL